MSSSSAAWCVAKREVRARELLETGVEGGAGAVDRRAQVLAEAVEALDRERVEQRLAVGEVPARGGVADADVARELAQRQVGRAALVDDLDRPREQRGAEVAVVVGARRGRGCHARQPTECRH